MKSCHWVEFSKEDREQRGENLLFIPSSLQHLEIKQRRGHNKGTWDGVSGQGDGRKPGECRFMGIEKYIRRTSCLTPMNTADSLGKI